MGAKKMEICAKGERGRGGDGNWVWSDGHVPKNCLGHG
jgi:hypothetical protein